MEEKITRGGWEIIVPKKTDDAEKKVDISPGRKEFLQCSSRLYMISSNIKCIWYMWLINLPCCRKHMQMTWIWKI